jgi:MFS family permease
MLRESLAVSIGWLGISMVADGVPSLLLPHRLLADGQADASRLGLITLVAIGLAALLQPGAGWVSDRLGRWPVIGAGTALGVGGLALLLAPGGVVPGSVVALAGASIAQGGQQALLPDRIRAGWRGRAGGLKSAFDVAGAFAGFVILAALLDAGRTALASGVLAASLVAGAVLTRILLRSRPAAGPVGQPQSAPTAGMRLLQLVVARFLFLLGIYAVGRFLLLFVAERFDLGADAAGGEAGTILALLALATIAASVPGGWLADRVGRKPLMLLGGAMGAVGIGLLPAAGSLDAVLAFGVLMAVGSAAFGSASWAMLADLTRSAHTGRLMGVANLGTAGAAAAAGLFGFVVDSAGFEPAFVLAAACSLAGGALAWTLGDVPRPAKALAGSTEGAF